MVWCQGDTGVRLLFFQISPVGKRPGNTIYHVSILFDSWEIGIIPRSKLQLLLFIKLRRGRRGRGLDGAVSPDIIITIFKTSQRIGSEVKIKLAPR